MAGIDWQDAIARVVRRHRADIGISQEKLAELAQLSRGYISRIETGDVDISISVFARLANALGMTATGMMQDAESATPRRKVRAKGE